MVICQGLVTKTWERDYTATVMLLAGLCITISMFQSHSEGIYYLPMVFYGLYLWFMVWFLWFIYYLWFIYGYGICMVYGLPGLSRVPSISGETT